MLNGACLCGRVQYEIHGKPRFMYQCHCGKCRAASGASFATNIIVDADKFRITAGKESLGAYESSPQKFRYFCAACGSPIYSHGEKTKQVVAVRCGTLKQDPGVRLAYHAFVGSKAPWTDIRDGLPQFDEWPDPELVKRLFSAVAG
ncbi:MAG: GFA family protein [Sphingomonadaceae bacterium]